MNEVWIALSDVSTRTVLLGSALLGGLAGAVGTFAVLRRQSLLGDVLAHAALPGIVVAFMLSGVRQLPLLLLGALVSGALWSALLGTLARRTRLPEDAATSLTLSVSFALGLALLTRAQQSGDGGTAGLQYFLFGQAASLLPGDVVLLASVTAALAAVTAFAWPALAITAFDPGYARTIGVPVAWVEAATTAGLAVAVVLGLQLVGVVLMTALVVAPSVAARPWAHRLAPLVLAAAGVGAVSGVIGAAASAIERDAATGPVVVVAVSLAAFVSVAVAEVRTRRHAGRRST